MAFTVVANSGTGFGITLSSGPATHTSTSATANIPIATAAGSGSVSTVQVRGSLELNASSDKITRTSNLPSLSSFTMAGWFKRVTDRNSYETFASIDNGAGGWITLQIESSGNELKLEINGSGTGFGSQPTVGDWVYAVLQSNGTTVTGRYWNEAGTLLDTATSSASSFTPNAIYFGSNGWGEELFGRVSYARVWNAVLSQSELEAEMFSETPVRTSNLDSALHNASAVDLSGNGRNWSLTGITASSDFPDVFDAGATREGTGAANLLLPTASGTGIQLNVGAGASTIGLITASGAGSSWTVCVGDGAASLPLQTASGVGIQKSIGTGASTLPLAAASGSGKAWTNIVSTSGASTLPIATADAS